MKYRRKSGGKPLRRLALAVLLAGVVLYALWAGGFLNYFSPSIKVNSANSKSELGPLKHLRRGIYDRNMDVLALSLRMYSVYARPLELPEGGIATSLLGKCLDISSKRLLQQLRTEKKIVWLKRHIDSACARKIAALHLSGIYLVGERQRLYPHGNVASQVIGFVKEEQGLAGTEFVYDNLLRGGWPLEPASPKPSGIDYSKIPKEGAAVVLTLDLKLQTMVERRLATLINKTKAQSGMAVLMDAKTGEIMAMANLPSYDPNSYWNYSSFNRRNRANDDHVYLGGLAEYLRLAAAIQAGTTPVPEANPGQGLREISPRQNKRSMGGQAQISKSVWQKDQDGIYRSPYITVPDVLSIASEQLEQFIRQLGLDKSATNDRLSGPSPPFSLKPLSQTTLLDLAAAFARMINGGQDFVPHLLHGVWIGPDKGEIKAHFTSSTPNDLFPQDGFLKYLHRLFLTDSSKPLVLESLVTVQEKVSPDIEFADEEPLVVDKETSGNNESADKIMVGGSEQQPRQRMEALGVGVNSAGSSPQVLVMTLDGVSSGFAAKPVFSEVMAKILRRKVVSKKPYKGGRVGGYKPQGFNRKWREIHLKKSPVNVATGNDDSSGVMPKLKGFSLRKSLQNLSGHGLHLQIVGSGHVVKQDPKAGMPLKSAENCRLELRFKAIDIDSGSQKSGGLDGTTTH